MKTFFIKLSRGIITSFIVVAATEQNARAMVQRFRSHENITNDDFAVVQELTSPMILPTY